MLIITTDGFSVAAARAGFEQWQSLAPRERERVLLRAADLVEALPAATHLVLAFEAGGGPSPGTAKTSVEKLGEGGRIRRDVDIVKLPTSYKTRQIPFAHAERTAVTIPWGDVFTAWASTGEGTGTPWPSTGFVPASPR